MPYCGKIKNVSRERIHIAYTYIKNASREENSRVWYELRIW